jgi:hypothetical protein
MTERQTHHSVKGFHSQWRAVLMAFVVSALACACSSSSSASTGTLKGTAAPCAGAAPSTTSHAWEVQVILRRGPTVIARRTVLDTQAADEPTLDQIFSFTEPPGSYSVSGSTPKEQPVVIKAGITSTVSLPGACR